MGPAKAKVAIIDDDLALTQIYRTALQKQGYEVDSAGDGASGLKLVHVNRPDVVLLDLMMPKMSGIEFLQKLPATGRPKIIVLSNMDTDNLAQSIRAMGVDDYFVKTSVTPTVVMARIEELTAN
jgi:DNA-binding response OmpR family regulator